MLSHIKTKPEYTETNRRTHACLVTYPVMGSIRDVLRNGIEAGSWSDSSTCNASQDAESDDFLLTSRGPPCVAGLPTGVRTKTSGARGVEGWPCSEPSKLHRR